MSWRQQAGPRRWSIGLRRLRPGGTVSRGNAHRGGGPRSHDHPTADLQQVPENDCRSATTLCGASDRTRAALQQIFGEIRLVPEENEVWADVSAFGQDQILKW